MSWTDILPGGIPVIDAIAGLSAMAALIAMVAVWQTLLVRDPVKGQLKRLNRQRDELRAASSSLPSARRPLWSADSKPLTQLLKRLDLLRSREAEKTAMKLAQAGYRGKEALVTYQFLRLTMPMIFGFVGALVLIWLGLVQMPEPLKLPAVLVLTVVGYLAPDNVLGNRAKKRKAAIQKAVPDGIDLMVICAEAGLSIDAAFSKVAREMGQAGPEFADELELTSLELTFLTDRGAALNNLNNRTDMPSIRALVSTLKQTEKYGTPLAQSLRVLAAEFREQRMLNAEAKAARLPVLLTIPMMLFVLPPLFVVLMGPAIMRIMDTMRQW